MTELEQEIAHLQELRARHRKNIHRLEEQLATYGKADAPLHLFNKLDSEREQLRQVEERLKTPATQAETEAAPVTPAELREVRRKEKPTIWSGLPIWGWGVIALVAALIIGGAIFLAIQRGEPMVTPVPIVQAATSTATIIATAMTADTPTTTPDTSTSTFTNTPTSAPNDAIAYYPFEVISNYDTQCWRVRTTLDGVPLGTEVKPALGKGREGSGALEFSFTLPLAQGGVGGAQIDQMGEGPKCAKLVPMIPSTGQVELWVYLDAGASEGEDVILKAEPFFAAINMTPAWLYGPAVDLEPNQWNRVCWDRSNSPPGVGFGGDDWTGQLQAFGLEIKLADPTKTVSCSGRVYVDDVRLIHDTGGQICP